MPLVVAEIDPPVTLNRKEAARLLGVAASTFDVYRKAGLLRGCESRIPGRWSRDAILALANGRAPQSRRKTA